MSERVSTLEMVDEAQAWRDYFRNWPEDMERRGVLVVPDILANAGGVVVSYFEWVQDRNGYFWKEDEVNERLEEKMVGAFDAVWSTRDRFDVDTRTAAYILAVERIIEARSLRGLYA